jgi:transcriptional antiterminator NusG
VGEGNDAIPLSEEEVLALGVEKKEITVAYSVGDTVRITDGALSTFIGVVDELDIGKNKVRVIVSMFGRETPVELELNQVELVEDE